MELFERAGVDEMLVVEFTPELSAQEPEEFAERVLRPIGADIIVAGEDFRFGTGGAAISRSSSELGFDGRRVPLVEALVHAGSASCSPRATSAAAAELLGRPPEVEGIVVGATSGADARLSDREPRRRAARCSCPAYGIYAGAALGGLAPRSRSASNPHYGGVERRIEAYLLDFEGDLYGRRHVVELWQRLRDERAFESEADLVEQIARDIAETRTAERPPVEPD